jgi:hypothetical protein
MAMTSASTSASRVRVHPAVNEDQRVKEHAHVNEVRHREARINGDQHRDAGDAGSNFEHPTHAAGRRRPHRDEEHDHQRAE